MELRSRVPSIFIFIERGKTEHGNTLQAYPSHHVRMLLDIYNSKILLA